MRWTYRFAEDSFPAGALDDHVKVGGAYFDLRDTSYTLTPEEGGTRLHIRVSYRISTDFDAYANWVAQRLLGNFSEVILDMGPDCRGNRPGPATAATGTRHRSPAAVFAYTASLFITTGRGFVACRPQAYNAGMNHAFRLLVAAAAALPLAAAMAQAPAQDAAAPAKAEAPPAPSGRPDQTIKRIRTEDAGTRIDELRVGGETQQIMLQVAVLGQRIGQTRNR